MCIYVNILPFWTWDAPWHTHTHTKTCANTHTSQRWDGCRRGGRSAAIRGAVCVMVAMCGPISSTITHTHTAPTSRIPPRYRTLLKTLATNALMPSRRRGVWLELKWQTQRNAGLCLLSVWGRAPAYFWFEHDGALASCTLLKTTHGSIKHNCTLILFLWLLHVVACFSIRLDNNVPFSLI